MTIFSGRRGGLSSRAGTAAALALGLGFATLAGPAAAATLSIAGGSIETLSDGTLATVISRDQKRADRTLGLRLDRGAEVTITYLSGETGARHRLGVPGAGEYYEPIRTEKTGAGTASEAFRMEGGLLNFVLKTRGAGLIFHNANHWVTRGDVAVAFGAIFNGGKSVIARFDNGSGGSDFTDVVARIDVVQTPLPAAAWLLLGSFGGLGLVARRRRAPPA